jgi:hypothetical protein
MIKKIVGFKWEALLLLTLCILGWYYGYGETMFLPPQSMDLWRQSDCASMALNYYQDGMNFFLPRLHHCLNNDGCAVGECPLIYYFVAILYKIFGVHEFLFRLTNILIFVCGMLALYKIVWMTLKDRFYAFLFPLLLFSCPLMAFFTNNFLPDVPSLSFTLMAWLQLLKYKQDQKNFNFIGCMIFFMLAILLKANSAISFVAVGALFVIELVDWHEFNEGKKIFNKLFLIISGFLLAALVVFIWYKWSIDYNEEHRSDYFGKQSWPWWPLWRASAEDFVTTVISVFSNFYYLFNIFTSAIFLFSLIFILLNRRYLPDFLFGSFTLLLIGISMFFCYFFVGFRNQGYYYINLMILPVFSFICMLYILKEKYPKIFGSIIFKLFAVILLLLNIDHTASEINENYYNNGGRHTQLNSVFYEDDFKAFVKSKIAPKDRVISLPDEIPNGTLYALNLTGWNRYGFANGVLDSARIADYISRGAKYMIIADPQLLKDSVLKPFIKKEIGSYKNVYIFNLK